MLQAVLRKYSARRLAFARLSARTFTVAMRLGAVVCILVARYHLYATLAAPHPQLLRPDELAGVTDLAILLLFWQVFMVLILFILRARSRRAVRDRARSLQTQAEAD